ncbi:MAG TPA: TolC family protein [Chitinophagaceae bacterium]
MKKLIVIFFCGSINAFAQETISLPGAINTALKNSLDIQVSRNNVEANSILNSYGVAGGLPLVTTSATNTEQVTSINQKYSDASRNAQRSNAASNSLNVNVTGSILLYNGMRVSSTKKRLAELEQQSRDYLNSQVQNIIASVMTNYYDIVRQQSYARLLSQTIEVSKQRLEITKTQQSVGLANNADIFQAQLDMNAAIQALESQQLIIQQAKTDLLTLLTLDPRDSIHVLDTFSIDKNILLDSVLNRLGFNADIIYASEQVKINELIAKETAAQRYPLIRANMGYIYNRNQNSAGFTLLNQSYGPFVGLSLSIPIYNGNAYKRQQQAAEIDTKNAELQKEILIRDYSSSVVKQYQGYMNNLKQVETEKKNYELAQQLLDLVLQRFQLRVATILDLRVAQQTLVDAGYRLINVSYAAKAAEIELKRLSNTLTF